MLRRGIWPTSSCRPMRAMCWSTTAPVRRGRIAIDALKTAPPDGRTMLLTPASTITIYSAVYKKLSYNPFTDLLPVSLVCTFVHGFAVGPLVPAEVKTLAQYAAWAKANPGKSSCGNPGEGSFPHFLSMLLARGLNAPIQAVPYRGGAQALTDMAAGQLASLMPPDALSALHQGWSCPRAGDQRRETFAVPSRCRTFAEQGVKDIVVTEWFGIFAPPATPAAPSVAPRTPSPGAYRQGAGRSLCPDRHGAEGSTPAKLAAMIKSDSETWMPRIKEMGFQPIE